MPAIPSGNGCQYTTFPEFKRSPPSFQSEEMFSRRETKKFSAYLNKKNVLGAFKVLSYVAFAVPLGIGFGLNYGFNTLKDKFNSLANRNITVKITLTATEKEKFTMSLFNEKISEIQTENTADFDQSSSSEGARANTSPPDIDEFADDAKSSSSGEQ